jgi:hypothetical protein
MDSSRGFGSHRRHWRPVQTRFPCGCPSLATVNLKRDADALAGSFYKRHAISPWSLVGQWPLTAGEYVVSGSLSSPLRGAFHLSLTVLVHYRSLKVLSLGGWSPPLPTNSPGFVVLRDPASVTPPCSTGLSPATVALSNAFESADSCCMCRTLQPPCFHRSRGLGSSRLARHYYGNLA